jgi:hypothetical protein
MMNYSITHSYTELRMGFRPGPNDSNSYLGFLTDFVSSSRKMLGECHTTEHGVFISNSFIIHHLKFVQFSPYKSDT